MKKQIIVIKLSGHILFQKKWLESLLKALKSIIDNKYSVIIVHGGGKQADILQKKLGIPIKKINGRRITNKKTLEIVKMVYGGLININLVAQASKAKISAIGISGADGKLVSATKRLPQKVKDHKTGKIYHINFGYVGDIKMINKKILEDLLDKNYAPIISCLGINNSGDILNINADTLATTIACEINADKLVFITNMKGIAKDKNLNKYYDHLTLKDAKEMIKNKKITDGMIAKIENIETAISFGLKNIQIIGSLTKVNEWIDALKYQKYGTVITGGNYEN